MSDQPLTEDTPQWLQEARARELAQFAVGTQVVVTLNGECRRGVWHGEQEIGVRGTVIGTDATNHGTGHCIAVWYDQPLPVRGNVGYYTPGELRVFDVLAEIEKLKREYAACTIPGKSR